MTSLLSEAVGNMISKHYFRLSCVESIEALTESTITRLNLLDSVYNEYHGSMAVRKGDLLFMRQYIERI